MECKKKVWSHYGWVNAPLPILPCCFPRVAFAWRCKMAQQNYPAQCIFGFPSELKQRLPFYFKTQPLCTRTAPWRNPNPDTVVSAQLFFCNGPHNKPASCRRVTKFSWRVGWGIGKVSLGTSRNEFVDWGSVGVASKLSLSRYANMMAKLCDRKVVARDSIYDWLSRGPDRDTPQAVLCPGLFQTLIYISLRWDFFSSQSWLKRSAGVFLQASFPQKKRFVKCESAHGHQSYE